MDKDYYKILDLSPDCTLSQIKSQFRKLAKQYHPDKHSGNHRFAKRFVEIKEAYDVLKDEELRREYDCFYGDFEDESIEDERQVIPFIISFRCNTKTFTAGEPITFHWEVTGADYIEIKPFGQVHPQKGNKTVRITDDAKVLKVKIIAKNTKTGEFTTEIISLKRKQEQASTGDIVPVINSFTCNTDTFKIGEAITFRWKISGANYIKIEPFGVVHVNFRFKKVKIYSDVEVLKVKLIAKNTNTGKGVSKFIILQQDRKYSFATSNNNQRKSSSDDTRSKSASKQNHRSNRSNRKILYFILGFSLLLSSFFLSIIVHKVLMKYYEMQRLFEILSFVFTNLVLILISSIFINKSLKR